MGDEAAAIAKSNYKNTPLNIKRLLGRKFAEPEVTDKLRTLRSTRTAPPSPGICFASG